LIALFAAAQNFKLHFDGPSLWTIRRRRLDPELLIDRPPFLDFTDGWCWRPFLDIADILPQREALKVL